MKAAFIDTSAVAAVLLQEPGFNAVHRCLLPLERLCASGLLEAEIRMVAAREGLAASEVEAALAQLDWVFPDRPLSREMDAVIRTGVSLRGADLWHVACALFLAQDPSQLDFITLDRAQAQAARALGFRVLPGNGGTAAEMGVSEAPAGYRASVARHRKKGMRK